MLGLKLIHVGKNSPMQMGEITTEGNIMNQYPHKGTIMQSFCVHCCQLEQVSCWSLWEAMIFIWHHCQGSFCVCAQWETTLQCNIASHWLSAYTKWSLTVMPWDSAIKAIWADEIDTKWMNLYNSFSILLKLIACLETSQFIWSENFNYN